MLTHKNICSNLEAMCQMTYIGPEDIFLSVLPIHHAYECTCGFLCPIYRGCTIAICEGLRHITKNLQESKATMMLAVPLILETMYKRVWDTARKNGMDKKLKTALKISKLLLTFKIDKRRKLFQKYTTISADISVCSFRSRRHRSGGFERIQGFRFQHSPRIRLNGMLPDCHIEPSYPIQRFFRRCSPPNLDVKIDNPTATVSVKSS